MISLDNVVDDVVYNKQDYNLNSTTNSFIQIRILPKFFQLNNHYNINNIIIFGENNNAI
jgi:hypothetical protein